MVQGLALRGDALPRSGAGLDRRALGSSPVDGFFAERPEASLCLGEGRASSDRSEAVGWHTTLREATPGGAGGDDGAPNPFLARVYMLPVPTQRALRALLLLPLGALVVAVFRNLVGVQTFGTFMPVLVAFALREASLSRGLLMVAVVVLLAILLRLALERLRLPPRLSVLLCVVAHGHQPGTARSVGGGDLYTAVLFLMVSSRCSSSGSPW
jgi:hypothetical protein